MNLIPSCLVNNISLPVQVVQPMQLTVEPEVLISGRDVIIMCNGVKGKTYHELSISRIGKGVCGRYQPGSNICDKPSNTACGIDQDISVSCPVTSPHVTPYVRIAKKNLDTDDTGIWECMGYGAFPLSEYVTVTVGK